MTGQQFVAALLGFQSREPDPRLRPDPFHLRQLADRVASAFSSTDLDPELAGRLGRAIHNGFVRLDALSRDDPFWADTNRRPTIGKIGDFAGQALERETEDDRDCWAYAACSLLRCGNDFGLPGLRRLHALGRLDPRWADRAAYFVRAATGYDTAAALLRFLEGIGAAGPAWALSGRGAGQ